MPDCGPADGPAVTVYLTRSPVDSVMAARFEEPTRPYVRMSFYDAPARLNGRRFPVRREPGWGWVELCQTGGDCAPYVDGWVRLEAVGPGLGIRGELSIDGPRAGTLRGGFEGAWWDRRMLCG